MTRRAGAALLAMVTVLLMLAVGLELQPANREDTAMRDIPKTVAGPRQSTNAAQLAQAAGDRRTLWVQTALARPLFAPNRRPVAADQVAAGQAPPSLPRIAGILVDGNRRSVIFAAAAGGRPIIATEGADVNGFKVQAIEANQVTIVGPDGTRVLHPSFDASRIVPNAPAPPGIPGSPSVPGLPVAPVSVAPVSIVPGPPAR